MTLRLHILIPVLISIASCSPKAVEKEHNEIVEEIVPPGMEGTLRAFVELARVDWSTALNMMGTPEIRARDDKNGKRIFEHPIENAAFFSQPILSLQSDGQGSWVGGIYNIWVNQWLLVEFKWNEVERSYEIHSCQWYLPPDERIEAADTDSIKTLKTSFNKRLKSAEKDGVLAMQNLLKANAASMVKHQQSTQTRLQDYISLMRSALAPDGNAATQALRSALKEVVPAIESGEWKAQIGEPKDAKDLFPVYFFPDVQGMPVVLYASYEDPMRVFVAQFSKLANGDVVLVHLSRFWIGPEKEVE